MIYVNGSPLNVTLFPDKTSQVWKVPQLNVPGTNWVNVKWDFEHEGEFMHLAQLKNLLDSKGFDASLNISYLPYARQDKQVSNESTFALHTFAKLLNTMNFQEIIIQDAHSEIAIRLIHNSTSRFPVGMVWKVQEITNTTLKCYPDEGALEKYSKIYAGPYIHGEISEVQQHITYRRLSETQ